jgi:dTDP-4-amino-4,6-dideoxygalactose transaminase
MTEMQAALGLSQLDRLDAFVARRTELAARYDRLLSDLPVIRPAQHPDSASSYHLYPIRVADRAQVFAALRAAGIGVNVHYIPVHAQPFWQARGFQEGDFPESEAHYSETVSLPLYAGLSDADQDKVIAALAQAVLRKPGTTIHTAPRTT